MWKNGVFKDINPVPEMSDEFFVVYSEQMNGSMLPPFLMVRKMNG